MAENMENEQIPLYMNATVDDFIGLELESVLDGCHDAELDEAETLLRKASKAAQDTNNMPVARAFAALAAAAGFLFTPERLNEPFKAMLIERNRRSAVPDDFEGAPIAGLETIALDIKNLPLRARICDLLWIMNRANYKCGKVATDSYHQIVLNIQKGVLTLRDTENRELGSRCEEFLRRALAICRGLNNPPELFDPISSTINVFLQLALDKKMSLGAKRLCELSLDFQTAEPAKIASDIELALTWENDISHQASFWSLAASAYHVAKDDDEKWRCQIECAESFVRYSETMSMAMLKSHWLSNALTAYQGIPNQRERRTELRHTLIDAQVHINEEMSQFEHPMDLSEIIKGTKEKIESVPTFEKLRLLASLYQSANPDKLKADAVEQIRKHPLSSLFGKTQHDSEGKVIHKSSGGDLREASKEAIEDKIAESQRIMRSIVISSVIHPVLHSFTTVNFPHQRDIWTICENSVFIPVDRKFAYFEGIRNFLFGSHLAALNILVPQMENSIRYVLKQHDFDPTSFNTSTEIQEDRPLTSIYSDMREELEQCFGLDITFEIGNLFLRKSGPNIRNNVAHGLLSDNAMLGADAVYANWFIYRLCCIPLFPNWSQLSQQLNK